MLKLHKNTTPVVFFNRFLHHVTGQVAHPIVFGGRGAANCRVQIAELVHSAGSVLFTFLMICCLRLQIIFRHRFCPLIFLIVWILVESDLI